MPWIGHYDHSSCFFFPQWRRGEDKIYSGASSCSLSLSSFIDCFRVLCHSDCRHWTCLEMFRGRDSVDNDFTRYSMQMMLLYLDGTPVCGFYIEWVVHVYLWDGEWIGNFKDRQNNNLHQHSSLCSLRC
jgi:hypothetical protein